MIPTLHTNVNNSKLDVCGLNIIVYIHVDVQKPVRMERGGLDVKLIVRLH